ncbi:putative mannose-6-phosphate isomerase, variant 2 [Clonorchis sinensis]|uniref:mannose-6-phosphate isomerase n=2 Tax=Clonorchis sinensis TaxID=79923 RepID=A0A8T1LZZ8_CLOSI|nr:putative mannose-6-phosphate isomerase [Clonorchis sinensis]KAG5442155.1 putative mannose-6-phosphate isomerase, variant 2 [Clonorchis sinensis]
MLPLSCAVQTYEWGKIGEESEVMQLAVSGRHTAGIDPSSPFAELWMGTHPSGPSVLREEQETYLSKYISEYPECLGSASREAFGMSLPFLFKVLSIRKALSIQAHPTKEHAQLLHRQRPDLYKDPNHKPELAIALSPFEALLAFRPSVEIAAFVQGIPELLEIVGNECLSDLIAVSNPPSDQEDIASVAVKAAYGKLMLSDPDKVSALVNRLQARLSEDNPDLEIILPQDHPINLSSVFQVYLRLAQEFPGDVGCFSLFFLNYIKLEPGQAVYLEPNLPHAYLSGDCIECMACSDNVVRAGLTPKFKDVECLLGMLQYDPRSMDDLIFPGTPRLIEGLTDETLSESLRAQIISFIPPVEDFAVDKIVIPRTVQTLELLPIASASILLFIHGSGFLQRLPCSDSASNPSEAEYLSESDSLPAKPVARVHEVIHFNRGSVVFISANVPCCVHHSLTPKSEDSDGPLLAFRAYANVEHRRPSVHLLSTETGEFLSD